MSLITNYYVIQIKTIYVTFVHVNKYETGCVWIDIKKIEHCYC